MRRLSPAVAAVKHAKDFPPGARVEVHCANESTWLGKVLRTMPSKNVAVERLEVLPDIGPPTRKPFRIASTDRPINPTQWCRAITGDR